MASNEQSSATLDLNTRALTLPTGDNRSSGYSKRHSRITKENLFMILALWMQDFPLENDEDSGASKDLKQVECGEVSVPEASQSKDGENLEATRVKCSKDSKPPCKKVGTVLVSPNDIVYAVDCTRDGVHGIARLLIKHHDIPESCKVFVSRKPCSFCTKLLVQSGKIKRVLYLPFEPEYHTYSQSDFENETVRVDTLFKASAIGQSVFVPVVEKAVRDDAEDKQETPVEETPVKQKDYIKSLKQEFFDTYYNETWMEETKDRLPWPAFNDCMKARVKEDFKDTMEWIARILVLPEKVKTFMLSPLHLGDTDTSNVPFDPVANQLQLKQAERLLEMARFLAERSDDPRKGVGAVITNKNMEIQALGWNGFPSKALYGDFPRASNKDDQADKKYPYLIHAEQNALLVRNDKNLNGGTLFVTKTPCDECVPLLEMQGIQTVIIDEESRKSVAKKEADTYVTYKMFPEKVKNIVFFCFEREITEMIELRGQKRKLSFEEDQETG